MARLSALVGGCTCSPDVVVRGRLSDSECYIQVQHDEWCALLLRQNRQSN